MTTDTTPAAIEALLKDADVSDAPAWLNYSDAQSWASGYNDAVSKLAPLAAELTTARAERDEARNAYNDVEIKWALAISRAEKAETELAALCKEVERLRAGITELARHPEDDGAHMAGSFRDFYRDSCNFAAKLLISEPLGYGITADDFGGEA